MLDVDIAGTDREAKEGQIKIVGAVSGFEYDPEMDLFTGLVNHRSGKLRVTKPLELEPELRSIKILASTVQGWLYGPEMDALFLAAQAVSADQVIVEIGSFCGRSTVCLGWGSKLGNRVKVYAVDTHKGSEEHWQIMQGSMGSYSIFQTTMRRSGLNGLVAPMVMTSEKASQVVQSPVGLLFIDGDHKSAHPDFDLWYHLVAPGGTVMFHDSIGGGWPDVETDVRAILKSGRLEKIGEAGTITIGRKPDAH